MVGFYEGGIKMLRVTIEDQLKSEQPVEYHYLELMRSGLLQLAKKLARRLM